MILLSLLAGFWQYGTLKWDEFYRYLAEFVYTDNTAWTVFEYDPVRRRGAPCLSGAEIVPPGSYIVLSSSGEPIRLALLITCPRLRNPSAPALEAHCQIRGYARDQKCIITGLRTNTYTRLKVAHIFPQGHDTEWVHMGYPSRITDTADEAVMGPMKINSIQNLITLRGDLYDAWENYEYGVDPNNNYRITAFTNGNEDINGRFLQLDHIKDPTLRPLDELFTDHFMQGLYMHMKGTDPPPTHEDDDLIAFGDGPFDLSNTKAWGTREGKARLEFTLADRLFDHQLSQQDQATSAVNAADASALEILE
ncbi:hypothetical protein BGW80DRAFT_600831 [Lactifluus volemus]|nr:hypothetical protein BGW80DRAFT_600831 [Lactifluus volemus]